MRPVIDLTGRVFGRLTVIERSGSGLPVRWRCRCECGNETASFGTNLKAGTARSCGCLRDELVAVRMTKHGRHDTPEYQAWANAKSRCHNSHAQAFRNYGGRGIVMCDRWRDDFAAFYADMGERPGHRYTLERIDNDGPYSPDNCRWATYSEQLRNTRQNRVLEFNGKRQPLMDWAIETGIAYNTLQSRLRTGHSIEQTLTAPVQSRAS